MSDEDIEATAAEGAVEAEEGAAEAEAAPVARPKVKLDVFEGPLDLLLHLIKKNEVEVTDIPIAAITEQYLGYLGLMQELRLDVAGEYLVMAATLMLIKSRMLLPQEAAGDDEDEAEDLRADLVRQLLEYQRYREVAAQLGERPQLMRDVFAREPTWDGEEALASEPGPIKVSIWELLEAFRRVLERAKPESVHEVQLERVSLRDKVHFILGRLAVSRRLDFESFFPEDATRLEIVVTFLATLELMRLRAIDALQLEQFGPIFLTLTAPDAGAVDIELLDEYEAVREEEGNGGAGS